MPASSLNRSRLSASLKNASGLSAAARSSERLMVSFNRSRSAVTSSSSVMPVALTRLRKRYEPLQADCHQSNSARDRPRAFIDSGDVKAEMAKEPLHSRSYSAVLGHVVMRHSLSRSFHAHHCSRRCHRAPRPTHRQGAQRAGRHRAPAGSARLASRPAPPSPALRLNKRPTIGSRHMALLAAAASTTPNPLASFSSTLASQGCLLRLRLSLVSVAIELRNRRQR